MGIEYKRVSEVLEEHGMGRYQLQLFNDRGIVIKVFCWQPKSRISFESDRGFYSIDSNHRNKTQSFLKTARENKADIVLAPEYSIPVEEVINLLEDGNLWPQMGKLWCLGMEGIPYDEIEKFHHIQNQNVLVIHEEMENISPSDFFSCVAHLFLCQPKKGKNGPNKLVCILQFKTSPASDSEVNLEAVSLTPGNCIYFFDDGNNHGLVSYICADALNQDIVTKRQNIQNSEIIILHPQLNPKPMHASFQQMRKNFLDYAEKRTRLISVNWARGTLIETENIPDIKIEDGGTAVYYNQTDREKGKANYQENRKKGLEFSKSGHIDIWHTPSNEHCILYTINGFSFNNMNNVAKLHQEPKGMSYYEFNNLEMEWKKEDACKVCSIDWDWLKERFCFDDCNHTDCKFLKLKKFFRVLFCDDEELIRGEDIFSNKEDMTGNKTKLRERCDYIDNALQEEIIPDKFSALKNQNYEWVMENNINIVGKGNSDGRLKACVAYIDASSKSIIERGISRLEGILGEGAMDKVILYHLSVRGIRYYDKLYNIQINDPNLVNSVDIIK